MEVSPRQVSPFPMRARSLFNRAEHMRADLADSVALPQGDGAISCECGQPMCSGAWTERCGLGLGELGECAVDHETVSFVPVVIQCDDDDVEDHESAASDARARLAAAEEAFEQERQELVRLLALAASALKPYRRVSEKMLGKNDPMRIYESIISKLGDRCPAELLDSREVDQAA